MEEKESYRQSPVVPLLSSSLSTRLAFKVKYVDFLAPAFNNHIFLIGGDEKSFIYLLSPKGDLVYQEKIYDSFIDAKMLTPSLAVVFLCYDWVILADLEGKSTHFVHNKSYESYRYRVAIMVFDKGLFCISSFKTI